jgi:prophage regulatory protein
MAQPTPVAPLHRIIRLAELTAFTGLQRMAIEELMKQGEFPKPVKVSARNKGWLESEVIVWQQKRIAQRDREAEAAGKKRAVAR